MYRFSTAVIGRRPPEPWRGKLTMIVNSLNPTRKIRIGISACLLGHKVRYDGSHKRDAYTSDMLSRFMEFVPVCPEAAIGLGVPRPPIRLTGNATRPRAVGIKDPDLDVTDALEEFARQKSATTNDISGYIVKRGSPSCGMERVKIYRHKNAMPEHKGSGIFTRIIQENLPLLPVEEEGRLNDPVLRENFINRVYVYRRWHQLVKEGLTAEKLIAFHTDHKYMLMSHCQSTCQELGKMLSDLSGKSLEECGNRYLHGLMTALKRRVNRKRHSNVLQHISGYLKRSLQREDKKELSGIIDAYREAELPLIVPVTLLKHHFRRYPDSYISRQYYLHPYPEALGLRNAL